MKRPLVLILLVQSFFVYAQNIPEGYYDGTDGLSGQALKKELHKILRDHKLRSYSEFRDTILPDLDEDPNNSSNIILFYKNVSIPKGDFASNNEPDFWNREHTWPSSHGFPSSQDTAYTDVHNLRPSDATVNTSKSNKDFNDVEHTAENEQGEAANTYTDEDFWEPRPEIKGDVARILFYMSTRYESDRLDLEIVDRESFSGDPEIGVLFTLLQWHEGDPVDQAEIDRHEKAYGYQENRNPFIDHPEWVGEIWGSSSDPNIILDQSGFSTDFGEVALGESKVQSYDVNGYNLTEDMNVSVEAPFQLSMDQENYSQSITFTSDGTEDQQFKVYLKYEPEAEDEVVTKTVTHESGTVTATLDVSGQEGELEVLSIADARAKGLGEVVTVAGVIIDDGNNSSNNRVFFDGTAGIIVRSFDTGNESANYSMGDSILVTGGLSEYNNLLQIEESPITIELLKENADLPAAQEFTIAQIGEEQESELVVIRGVTFANAGGTFQGGGSAGNFNISDDTGTLVFRIGSSGHPLVGEEIPAGVYDITGFIGQFQNDYQLSVRSADDMVKVGDVLNADQLLTELFIYPNPTFDGIVNIEAGSVGLTDVNALLIDISGKTVKSIRPITHQIDFSDVKSGIYYLSIEGSEGVKKGKLIIK